MSRADREQLRERSKRNDFSVAVRAHIRERDDERCVLCGRPGREVHHIIPRAQGGLGSADNGVCLDSTCHHQAHRSQAVERQLARYRERVLLPYYGLAHASDSLPDAVIDELLEHQRQRLVCLRKPVKLHG
jgi:5-methylcytosine-specific restriction endonuclease McrA